MTTHDPQLRDALTWVAQHRDAGTELKRDAKRALRLLDDAELLLAGIVNDNATAVAGLRDAERAALTTLCDAPTRDNVAVLVELRRTYDDTQALQLRKVHAAEHATNHARHFSVRVFSQHVDALLHLVALERCADVDACGTNAVPEHVRFAWSRLTVQYHPDLDELLLLTPQFRGTTRCPQRQHLPLTWLTTERESLRRKFAWCWQQIAAGNAKRVSVPLTLADRQRGARPGSLGTCLQLVAAT